MEVPPDGSNLSFYVEEFLGGSEPREGYHCEQQYGGCGEMTTAQHKTRLKSLFDRKYIIVLLRRLVDGPAGLEINTNRVTSSGLFPPSDCENVKFFNHSQETSLFAVKMVSLEPTILLQ